LEFLQRYAEEGIQLDNWWLDAGWYESEGSWVRTGTWVVDKKRYPKGIREVSDYAKSLGIKTITWFEPERVHSGTWLAQERPEWVHGGKDGGLLKLGDSECRGWMVDRIDKIVNEEGIDIYRQDFNIDPLVFWRANDTQDRQGITEIRHVEGYFKMWDELLRRHPGMLIDSCASGGRRNDLETLRRAVPLLRSDYIFDAVGEQCHTYGLSFWIPFNGTGFIEIEPYLVRSMMAAKFTLGSDVRRKDLNYNLLRKLIAEWREISDYFLGDYYPLTRYSLAEDAWMAWQFNRVDLASGVVQAFRRKESTAFGSQFKLHDLEPEATYVVKNFDNDGRTEEYSGAELMGSGLRIVIDERPAA
ncbi:MAG TPA: alpha-galactosidase, partial [bacterium]|nr:alpha-galactosidase [bacterium]